MTVSTVSLDTSLFRRSIWTDYIGAVVLVLLIELACIALGPTVEDYRIIMLLPAVSLIAYTAGRGPAIVGGLLGMVLGVLGGTSKDAWLAVPSGGRALQLGLHLAIAGVDILLIHRLRVRIDHWRRRDAEASHLLEQRRLLFQEMQHRVANNMQFVASMLTLQKSSVKGDEVAREALDTARERVVNVARIHRRLYDPELLAAPVALYLQDLCDDLVAALSTRKVVCVVEGSISSLELNRLVTLSLIVTEVLTNALKHAFGDVETGRIEIRLDQRADLYTVTIHDNGRGLPPDFDSTRGQSLGLRILQALVQQISGKLAFSSESGTTVHVTFQG